MIRHPVFILAVVALVGGLGVGLKAARYDARFAVDQGSQTQRIVTGLHGLGWRVALKRPIGPDQSFSVVAFTRPGCAGGMVVGILGRAKELIPFASRELGPDTLFLHNGALLPAAASLQIVNTEDSDIPILAVHRDWPDERAPEPAAATAADGCGVPEAPVWRGFFAASDAFETTR